MAPGRPSARAATAARFAVVCAVTGFTVSPAAGAVTALTRSSVHSGAAVLAAALTAAFRTAGAAGALAGVVILLAGVVVGYLAAGAVQLHAIAGAVTAPAARAALAAAAGHWALVAAVVTGAVAVAMACTPGRDRGGRTGETAGGAPVLGAGGTGDHR